MESWTSYDGKIWRRDTDAAGLVTYNGFAPIDALDDPSPQLLASLPTTPDGLKDCLQVHGAGSDLFGYTEDLLRGGLAPAALRAAAIRMLEPVAGITSSTTTDAEGRPAVMLSRDNGQAMLFDPDTSTMLETHEGPQFTATYSAHTVTAVPDRIIYCVGPIAASQPSSATPIPTPPASC